MRRLLILLITCVTLSACAHKDLKAPCINVVGFVSDEVPCDQREPVNGDLVPTIFAE